MTENLPIMHGLKLSYFTGKLEGYFRVKGIAYTFRELDTAAFRRAGRATGYLQMPQLEMPDGSWLTDTTAIIQHYEGMGGEPILHPSTELAGFYSLLLEDAFDEWLWRPALYYRWAFGEDMTLISSQIARTLLKDVPLPFFLRRHFILNRQRRIFLKADGITKDTAPGVEALFLDILDLLETIFSKRRFLFGERPVEADFGLFGPFFRHFSHDPTPHGIMRERAPHTLRWVADMWASSPNGLAGTDRPKIVPDDLQPLIDRLVPDYLIYLTANARAFEAGLSRTCFRVDDLDWSVPTAPYRVRCLNALKAEFGSLVALDRADVRERCGKTASTLAEPETKILQNYKIHDRLEISNKRA